MTNDFQILETLKTKIAHADQDCEGETRAATTDLQSKIKYEGGRLHVPNFQSAANLLVRVIYCKEKRFNSIISRMLEASGKALNPEELESAKSLVAGYFQEDHYLKRFDRFVEAVGRSASRYGLQFDPKVYRVDIASSLFFAGVKNATRRGLASVHAELEMHGGLELSKDNSPQTNVLLNKQGNNTMPDPKKIFVVHGRDNRLRNDFFAFLRALDLEPIEWSEALKLTGKATPYIGEAIDSAFKNAQAVIVLLSPDDEVRLSPELWKVSEDKNEKEFKLQARPNVLFEAGRAFGTHPDRTLLIEVGQVKQFSDVAGRHVIRLSNSAEKRNEVAERLRTSGCDVKNSGSDWLKTGNFNINRGNKSKSTNNNGHELPVAEEAKEKENLGLEFDRRSGTLISKATSLRYCQKCYHSTPQKCVELREFEEGWDCSVCGTHYPNPNWNPPTHAISDYDPLDY